jgi:hypothetical protein
MSRKDALGGAGRWLLAAALVLPAPLALAAPDEKAEEAEDARQDSKAEAGKTAKPRVITNKDLEKYGRGRHPSWRLIRTDRPAQEPLPPVPGPVEETLGLLPPEDRPGEATLEELVLRDMELSERLRYLEAKERWMRNPLIPAPTAPPGEALLDPAISGAMQLERTRGLIQETRTRLTDVRMLIQNWGEGN